MNKFSQRIKSIEAKIHQLKTSGLSSSATLKTISKELTINFVIVPYKVNYEWDNCASSQSARITIHWRGVPSLCSLYIKSPKNLSNRRVEIERLTNSSYETQFGALILSGSSDDLAYFNSGGTQISMPITFEVVGADNFTISYTMRQEH